MLARPSVDKLLSVCVAAATGAVLCGMYVIVLFISGALD